MLKIWQKFKLVEITSWVWSVEHLQGIRPKNVKITAMETVIDEHSPKPNQL